MDIIREWLRTTLSNRQVVVLVVFLIAGIVAIFYLGDVLAPVLVSLVLAYLLEPAVLKLNKLYIPRWVAAISLLTILMTLLVLAFVWLGSQYPVIRNAIESLFASIDINAIKAWLSVQLQRSEMLQIFISQNTIDAIDQQAITNQAAKLQEYFAVEPADIFTNLKDLSVQAIYLLVMLLLVPVMAFFMIKDKQALIEWFQNFLPEDRALAGTVWLEVDFQIGNYIRGKAFEIIVVGACTSLVFWYYSLDNYLLFGMIVGLSVLIPYVGSVVVTIPVFFLAILDPDIGWSSTLLWFMVWYMVVQILDGQVFVPIIFSEAVSMHPLAIIIAVLFFGGLWSFWGAFFAIPLAVLVNAVIKAWPRAKKRHGIISDASVVASEQAVLKGGAHYDDDKPIQSGT